MAEAKGDVVIVDREQVKQARQAAFGFNFRLPGFMTQGEQPEALSRLTTTIASLEEKTRDAEFANEWLVYLSTEIRQRLSDAPSKLAEMSRDVRARRFDFQHD